MLRHTGVEQYLPPASARVKYCVGNALRWCPVADKVLLTGERRIANMEQPFENLREHLFRHNSFPHGCYLMTGTGIVPNEDFARESGDEMSITIDEIGTLTNVIGEFPNRAP